MRLIDKIDKHLRTLAPHVAERESALLLAEALVVLKASENDAATGEAIQRAAKDLPPLYDISIDIEQGAGVVKLYTPDSDSYLHEWEADTFGGQINKAVDYAIKHHKENEG